MFVKIKIMLLKIKERFYKYKYKQCINKKKKYLLDVDYKTSYIWRERAAKYDIKRHNILIKLSEIDL